jgi:hypothetical protein
VKIVFLVLTLYVISGCSPITSEDKYINTSEAFVELVGHIDDSLSYQVNVMYSTNDGDDDCTKHDFSYGDRITKKYSYSYTPQIKDSVHFIRVPLRELNPNTQCNWRPAKMSICVNNTEAELDQCSIVFWLAGEGTINKTTTLSCPVGQRCFSEQNDNIVIGAFNGSYTLNIKAY